MSRAQNVPALITPFTPAPSCLRDYYIWKDPGFNFNSLGPLPTTACLPSGWDSTSTYFSPGICPVGYTVACSTVVNMGKLSETRATCCPSAYSCPRSGGPWYSDHPCTHTGTGLETWTYTSMSDGWTWHTGTTTAVRDVNAYGISIRWQAVDFASTPFTASASPTSTMTATSSTPSPSSPVSSSSGLSLRTQAGIGVSCAVAFLTLFFVG